MHKLVGGRKIKEHNDQLVQHPIVAGSQTNIISQAKTEKWSLFVTMSDSILWAKH